MDVRCCCPAAGTVGPGRIRLGALSSVPRALNRFPGAFNIALCISPTAHCMQHLPSRSARRSLVPLHDDRRACWHLLQARPGRYVHTSTHNSTARMQPASQQLPCAAP